MHVCIHQLPQNLLGSIRIHIRICNTQYHTLFISHHSNYSITCHVVFRWLCKSNRIRMKAKMFQCSYENIIDFRSLWEDSVLDFENHSFMEWCLFPEQLHLFNFLGNCSFCQPLSLLCMCVNGIWVRKKGKHIKHCHIKEVCRHNICSNTSTKSLNFFVLYFYRYWWNYT